MTDSSLDDFFAKKDKTKKKAKVKPGAMGDEDVSAKASGKKDKKKKDKEKSSSSSGTINIGSSTKDDEEWKDFEEEKKVDYTGLRIQTLQMSKEEQDREGAEGADNGGDEDENRERRDGASGPWNKTGIPTPSAPAFAAQTEPVKEESTPKAPSRYVPPAQRQGATSASSSTSLPSSRKKKEAPNVHSEEDFPTLGGAVGGPGSSPQYSSSVSSDVMPSQRRGINLALENKFSALQD
ncbi:hypothetical protein BsWGS_25493 [Bradybaena similaris]